MRSLTERRPSPALVVAVVALSFAVVGTAVAGPGAILNKISKSKVKKIANKQIDKAEPDLNVNSAKTADSATNADNADAVNGHQVTRIFAKIPPNSTQTIGTFDVFTIRATCSATGNVEDLEVDPSTTDADLEASGNGNLGPVRDSNNGVEDNRIDLDQGAVDNDRGSAMFSAARTGGTVLSGVIGFDDTNSFNNEAVCAIYGQVTLATP